MKSIRLGFNYSVLITLFLILPFAGFSQSMPAIQLETYAKIQEAGIKEVSGIVKSTQYPDVFWVHGDSGTPNKIYAISAQGSLISTRQNHPGTTISKAINNDWEDLAIGQNGTLILADIGNNCECRDDLKIYILNEPRPGADSVQIQAEYQVKYPKRDDILGWFLGSNFNAEGIFQRDGIVYILTKQPSKTRLFKLQNPVIDAVNELVLVESIRTEGLVTAADISPDGLQLAVLLYNQVYVLEIMDHSFLKGRKRGASLSGAEQIESITFDNGSLIIAEENGDLYRIQISDLKDISD
jgi:hypothetical protein